MALAAFAVPSMASAATWFQPNVNQTLTSSSFSVSIPGVSSGLACSGLTFGAKPRFPAASTMDINTLSNFTCTGTGSMAHCSAAVSAAGLPWTAVATSLTAANLNSINLNLVISHTVGDPNACAAGGTYQLTGSLSGGVWNNTTKSLTFTGATGLSLVVSGLSFPATINGTLVNSAHTLSLV